MTDQIKCSLSSLSEDKAYQGKFKHCD